jgi:ABC-type polysaccharide/polyol phosphate export permease
MKRFFKDLKRYATYTKYAAKSDLKAEVASSYLNWLWWILDPLLFMMVYTFIAEIVFRRKVEYFPIFVFIALTLWNFFNKTVLGSVKLVRANSSVVSKVYLPKFILVLEKLLVNGFKMMISFGLVIVMMIIWRVPLSWNIFYMIPIVIVLVLMTFGVSCFMLHFGVFVDDLFNVMSVVLRLMFYMSGIFYEIAGRISPPYDTILLKCNPIALLIQSARLSMLYSSTPYRTLICLWGLVALVLCVCGVKIIYKYENSYVKVM